MIGQYQLFAAGIMDDPKVSHYVTVLRECLRKNYEWLLPCHHPNMNQHFLDSVEHSHLMHQSLKTLRMGLRTYLQPRYKILQIL